MTRFIVDIDDTLIKSEKKYCEARGKMNYYNPQPIQSEIDQVNREFEKGNKIIIFTGRGGDIRELTEKQLKEVGVKYHELIMDKPDGIYIDATQAFRSIEEYNENKINI